MADFVAVLRKTIGTLGENTPTMREKVYDKARSTIEAKLAAINPPPPAAIVERQRKALEDAIAVVRADYAEKDAEKDEGLEDVFATLKTMGDIQPKAASPSPSHPQPAPPSKPAEDLSPAAAEQPKGPVEPAVSPTSRAVDPASETSDAVGARKPSPNNGPTEFTVERRSAAGAGKRRRTGMFAALVLLLVLAGGGYAVWMNKEDFSRLVGIGSGTVAETGEDVVTTAEELIETAPEEDDVAVLPPSEDTAPSTEDPAGEPEKFTQRLLPDGREVDEGRGGGQRTIGEGTSVAAIAQPDDPPAGADTQPGASQPETAEADEPETEAAAPETPAIAVGQRAIFYEERTSSAQGSADTGSIVWSIVQESPGGDLPPEPAIRAEAAIPGKDVQLRMTIRRNGDQTLPASHIVEMIFLTPDSFEGGSISSVSRISFKETEQAAGNPLIGIPAKIADGFFLIALGDAPAEVEANTTMLRRQSWVDIPIVYQSGRRALLTLEKGIPGDRVFQDALRAWEEASG